MRIALVILHADPARGGAERYTVDLAHALRARGHEVKLVATSFAESVSAGMRVAIEATGATRSGRYRSFLDQVDEHLSQADYDIVHAMLPIRRCDVYHPHAGIAAEKLSDWTIHFNPRRKLMARVEKDLLASKDAPIVLALSDYVKASIRQFYDLPDSRLLRLFNAVDLERFDATARQEPCPPAEVNALIIAQDFERKGLKQAIEAVAKVNDARLKLTVVGRDDPSEYRKLAEKLNANVTFAGPTSKPAEAYRSADFFVLPTKHDPCSLVVLEALAMGLPVISTRFNGACEIMQEGEHGFVLKDPADVDALAEAMRVMLNDDRRKQMSGACLALRAQLSFEHHVEQLKQIYQSRRNALNT